MSRFQDYEGTLIGECTITDEQKAMVARCMDTMDLWYGSALMMIWMLTKSPPLSRDYFTRGWCVPLPSRARPRPPPKSELLR